MAAQAMGKKMYEGFCGALAFASYFLRLALAGALRSSTITRARKYGHRSLSPTKKKFTFLMPSTLLYLANISNLLGSERRTAPSLPEACPARALAGMPCVGVGRPASRKWPPAHGEVRVPSRITIHMAR
ncbi:hypothetical protein DFH27DRAFT_575409 [Peziza echinospora]|nr:hypothetical protein DFH27DRAFT_575409 [Peziza echinospora]